MFHQSTTCIFQLFFYMQLRSQIWKTQWVTPKTKIPFKRQSTFLVRKASRHKFLLCSNKGTIVVNVSTPTLRPLRENRSSTFVSTSTTELPQVCRPPRKENEHLDKHRRSRAWCFTTLSSGTTTEIGAPVLVWMFLISATTRCAWKSNTSRRKSTMWISPASTAKFTDPLIQAMFAYMPTSASTREETKQQTILFLK